MSANLDPRMQQSFARMGDAATTYYTKQTTEVAAPLTDEERRLEMFNVGRPTTSKLAHSRMMNSVPEGEAYNLLETESSVPRHAAYNAAPHTTIRRTVRETTVVPSEEPPVTTVATRTSPAPASYIDSRSIAQLLEKAGAAFLDKADKDRQQIHESYKKIMEQQEKDRKERDLLERREREEAARRAAEKEDKDRQYNLALYEQHRLEHQEALDIVLKHSEQQSNKDLVKLLLDSTNLPVHHRVNLINSVVHGTPMPMVTQTVQRSSSVEGEDEEFRNERKYEESVASPPFHPASTSNKKVRFAASGAPSASAAASPDNAEDKEQNPETYGADPFEMGEMLAQGAAAASSSSSHTSPAQQQPVRDEWDVALEKAVTIKEKVDLFEEIAEEFKMERVLNYLKQGEQGDSEFSARIQHMRNECLRSKDCAAKAQHVLELLNVQLLQRVAEFQAGELQRSQQEKEEVTNAVVQMQHEMRQLQERLHQAQLEAAKAKGAAQAATLAAASGPTYAIGSAV